MAGFQADPETGAEAERLRAQSEDFTMQNNGMWMGATMLAVCLSATAAAGQEYVQPAPKKSEIAPGIYLFQTEPYGDVGLDGNSIAVTSNDGVLVFDANGTPAAARAVIAEIRKITDKPVKYLVISHWHWDHWFGAEAYKEAFPGVQIISQERERQIMLGPSQDFNKHFLEEDLPGYVDSLKKKLAEEEAKTPAPANLEKLKSLYEVDRFFVEQKSHARLTVANETYAEQLNIYLGEREIRVMNFGRAVTPGDTVVYLPKEKIALVGDLVVNPVTFALGGYPTEWLKALGMVDKLDANVMVTGHGEPLKDKELLHATMEVMRVLLERGKELRAQGMDADTAKAVILPELKELRVKIAGDNPGRNQQLEIYLVDWYLHRVYDELNGPLTDAIQPPPEK
jgi:glyoxylase-like metal-dependent hydrolase (beta-lactamase superfamily II)